MTAIASTRFEFRLHTDTKRRIERAAELLRVSTSDFARRAVEERAEEVLRDHQLMTVVPADFFDEMLQALDAPAAPNDALAAAAQRASALLQRR